MTERQQQIYEIAWRSKARDARAAVLAAIDPAVPRDAIRFLGRAESAEIGRRYWERVSQEPEIKVPDFDSCRPLLDPLVNTSDCVYWLNRESDRCGCFVLPAAVLIEHVETLRRQLGPDLLFATTTFAAGVCFEKDEYECAWRAWGLPKPP
jgi:hypothetical protein